MDKDDEHGCLYYFLLAQPEFLLLGMLGGLGEDVKREADAAAEDMGFAILVLIIIGLVYLAYKTVFGG